MEGEKHICPNCGMPVEASAINFKTRRAFCPWCQKNVIFPKRNSTASPNAVSALNEAYNFFLEKNFESAKNCAETVVSMVPNNVAALYILAYYKAFSAPIKNRSSLDKLFNETLPDAEFEIEEEEMFKELLLKTILHSGEYEEQIIGKFIEYDDENELCDFVEKFCPFIIARQVNTEWFTQNMVKCLKECSAITNIPKTWYALYVSISKSPDSPILKNTFYLKTKSSRFYSEYILPIGEIFAQIKDETLKKKFVSAYNKVKMEFEQKLKA